MRDTGIVAAKALEVLDCLGYGRKTVAEEVGCTDRTVRRWETGQHQPSRRNRVKLRAFVGQVLMRELAGPSTPNAEARRKRLNDAARALMTTVELEAERREREAFEAEMKAKYAAIRAEQPKSVTYQVDDPFAVIDQDKDLAMVEATF